MKLPIVPMGLNKPLPIEITGVSQPFWDALAEGQFLLQQCLKCKRVSFPPRKVCPGCHDRDLSWLPAKGKGTLYSVTRIHNSPAIYGILSPMQVAIVDLTEGVRLVSRWLPDGSTPALDSPIELVVTHHPDGFHYAIRHDSG